MPKDHISLLRFCPAEKVPASETSKKAIKKIAQRTCKICISLEGTHKEKIGKETTLYLNQSKDHKHKDGTKQEGTQETEVMASFCRPECVESKTHNNGSCQDDRFQNNLACCQLKKKRKKKSQRSDDQSLLNLCRIKIEISITNISMWKQSKFK